MRVLRSLTRRFFREFICDVGRYVTECSAGVRLLELAVKSSIIQHELRHMMPDRQYTCARYLVERGYRVASTRTDALVLVDNAR